MHIKRFNEFGQVNEGLSDIIKKVPFLKKYYSKAEEIAKSVKTKVDNLIKDLSDEDKNKIFSFTINKISPEKIVDIKENLKVYEDKEEGGDVIDKILKIVGIGSGASSFISALVSMVLNSVNQHGGEAKPWFIAFVVLLVISGITGATKQIRDIDESIITADDIDVDSNQDNENVWVLTVYDEDDNVVDTHEIVSEDEPTSQAFKYVENEVPGYRDGWDWSLMRKSFFR
jgi:hypothetical protein